MRNSWQFMGKDIGHSKVSKLIFSQFRSKADHISKAP